MESVNIGVGAHITAAALGGPRYDSGLTSEQRQFIENGIWLCQNCAKLVDNDPGRYTVEALRAWKTTAEAAALAQVEGGARAWIADNSVTVELSYKTCRIQPERHQYLLQVHLLNAGTAPLGPYFVEVEMPAMVVHNAEAQLLYVRGRSDNEAARFRVDSEQHQRGEVVYPGDKQLVMTVEYFMDEQTFRAQGQLFTRQVRATCYRRDIAPTTTAVPFRELQVY